MLKDLNSLIRDPGWKKIRIRDPDGKNPNPEWKNLDPGWKKFGFVMPDKHPESATLEEEKMWKLSFICFLPG